MSNAQIKYDEESLDLPVLEGTLGPKVLDINELSKLGVFTFDPGFVSTASCESKITFINGEKGVLLYRGYPIKQLAEKSSFLEVCYLLLNGELPTDAERAAFQKEKGQQEKSSSCCPE